MLSLRSPLTAGSVRLLSAVLAAASLTACSEKSGSGRGNRGGAPVIVGHAERRRVPLSLDAIGNVEPIRTATVRAQITGTLFKIDIREGQDVAEGDLLFEIDPRPSENALKSALADQQRIAVQLQNARDQMERYSALSVGAMVSKDQIQQIRDNVRTLEAQAAAADAAVASAKLQLGYCSIRAPISGRTGNLNVHEGDMIRTNDATALVTINQLSPIYVTFGVPQQHLAALNRYRAEGSLKVSAALGVGDDRPADGQLTFLDNTVDSTTGTIKLKATFPNDDHRLWPGQFASVTILLATPEVLTVPASAVQSDQAGQHVFVVKSDQTAEFRPIVTERMTDDFAVVSRGLAAGETVVTDGQLRVESGQPIQIKPASVLTDPETAQASDTPDPAPQAKRSGKKRGS